MARKTSLKSLAGETSEPLQLAADTDSAAEIVVLVTEHDQLVARLFQDYQSATLNLVFVRAVPFNEFDVEIQFKDGSRSTAKSLKIKDRSATP